MTASHETHERLVEEQAALRRVATLVARGARPEEIFAAVSNEVGRLVGTDSATVIRYDDDGQGISYVGSASKVRGAFPMGVHWQFQEGMASYDVYRTGRSARSGPHLITVDGPIGDTHRQMGIVSAVASPIVVEGRLWGAMAVHGQEPLPPDTEERVEKFTELVATAIANADSRSGLTRLAEEQAALRRVATLVARGTQPREVFAAVADEVGRLVGSDSATVMKFVDDDGPGIVFVGVASKMRSAFPLGAHWKFTDGMASAEVYRTGRSARSDGHDWSKVEGPVGETHDRLGIASTVASPIVVEGTLWGAMAVQSQDHLPIDTDLRLEKFTALVATAIANAEGRATLTRLADEQASLRRVATLVARGVRADELFAAVSNELGRLFGTDSATVVKYDDEGAGIIFVGVASRVSAAFPLGAYWPFREGMASAEVYRTGRSARTGTHLLTVEGPIGDVQRGLGITSSVASPIVVDGRLWGAMSVQSQTALPPDTDERVEKFTELLATAIADAESREALGRLAQEQAALRRVATLVAEGAEPSEVFETVTREVGILCGADLARMERFESDDSVIGVAGWSRDGAPELAVGKQFSLEGASIAAMVHEASRPVRVDSVADADGPIAEEAQALGIRSSVGCPIVVDGRLWGVIAASSRSDTLFPPGTEAQIAGFTELVATAIANSETRTELAASRARIVAAADQERRRVVRDLHDGAQQRMVHLIITLKLARRALLSGEGDLSALLAETQDHAERGMAELRELAHGILPAVLTRGGLRAGVDALAARMPVPVTNHVTIGRLPGPVEATAYFVVAEAFTNVAKHAQARHAEVTARITSGIVQVEIRDDGVGGAHRGGSGLTGLADRLAVLDGELRIDSPADGGTIVTAAIPLPR